MAKWLDSKRTITCASAVQPLGFQLFNNKYFLSNGSQFDSIHFNYDPVLFFDLHSLRSVGIWSQKYKLISTIHHFITEVNSTKIVNSLIPNLTNIKEHSRKHLYPTLSQKRGCTLMLLTNLAQPHWVSIDCTEKLIYNALCVDETIYFRSISRWRTKIIPLHVIKQQFSSGKSASHLFGTSRNLVKKIEDVCKSTKGSSAVFDMKIIAFLAQSTSTHLPPVFDKRNSTGSFRSDLGHTHIKLKHSTDLSGLMSCSHEVVSVNNIGLNVLQCKDGIFKSSIFKCDGITHCYGDDPADEIRCPGAPKRNKNQQLRCPTLFFMSFKGECQKFMVFGNFCEWEGSPKYTKEAQRYFLGPSTFKLDKYSLCKEKGAIHCSLWNSECFRIDQICHFSLDKSKHIVPCRNAEHMVYCKDFQCNAMYKCPDHYCIPWTYVCDGKIDCPYGPDEIEKCTISLLPLCYRMFKCSTVTQCVHLFNVCDMIMDCPNGEDEILCELLSLYCPENCDCLAMAIHCEGGQKLPSDFNHPVPYPTISLSLCFLEVKALRSILYKFQSMLFLKINQVNLRSFESKMVPPHILSVNLAMNALSKLSQVSFSFMYNLITLSLQSNMIVKIQTYSFEHLGSLKQLNLSNNLLVSLPERLFNSSVHLKLLTIQDIEYTAQSSKLLQSTNIAVLDVTDFHLCCSILSNLLCAATRDKTWFMTCMGILPNLATKIAFPVVSHTLLLINLSFMIVVAWMQHKKKAYTKAYNVITMSISVCFLVHIFHLLFIWGADLFYKTNSASVERVWQSSSLCFMCFCWSLSVSLVHQMLFTLLSLSRWQVVTCPIQSQFKRTKFCAKCLIMIAFVAFVACLIATILVWYFHEMVPNSLCSPFIDPTHSTMGVNLITFLAASVHLSCVIISTIFHVLLVSDFKDSKKAIHTGQVHHGQAESSDNWLVIQLSLLSVTNILCGMQYAVFIPMFFLARFPLELLVWNTILLSPFNSFAIPIVLLISSVKQKAWQTPKKIFESTANQAVQMLQEQTNVFCEALGTSKTLICWSTFPSASITILLLSLQESPWRFFLFPTSWKWHVHIL